MKYRIIEISCLVVAVIFIIITVGSGKSTKLSAAEFGAQITEAAALSDNLERDGLFFKKTFGMAADSFDSIYYFSSDDIMNVDELLVVKFSNADASAELEAAIRTYGEDKYNTFAQYDQTAADKLSDRLLIKGDNIIVYYVGSNPDAVSDAANKLL